jgi:hypothetical protein
MKLKLKSRWLIGLPWKPVGLQRQNPPHNIKEPSFGEALFFTEGITF